LRISLSKSDGHSFSVSYISVEIIKGDEKRERHDKSHIFQAEKRVLREAAPNNLLILFGWGGGVRFLVRASQSACLFMC